MNARELEEQARGRGYLRGCVDRESGPFPNLAPLSGEWAGESVRELLGDLIDALVRLGEEEDNAHDVVCVAYETGYSDGFGPVPDRLSVCPDCFDWFASIAGATESRGGQMPAGVAEYARAGVFVDVSDSGDSFGRYCDTCSDALAGARFDVAVFDSGENPVGDHACSLCGSDYNGPAGGLCEICETGQIDAGEDSE